MHRLHRSRLVFAALLLAALLPQPATAADEPAQPDPIQPAAAVHRPIFFPSGDELLVMSSRDQGDWELYRTALDGSRAERLTVHAGWDGYGDVSPDGRRIVFDRRGEDGEGIVLAHSDGRHPRWLVQGAPDVFLGGARFAPDGRSVLYLSEESGNREIYRLWLADDRREQLTDTAQNETDAVFSPDGLHIAYAVWVDDETSGLEILTLESSATDRVVTTTGRLYGVAWSPDGRFLYYNDDSDGDQEIYRVALADRVPEALTVDDVPDHLPVAAPDGSSIVFTSERDGAEAAFVYDLESGETRRLDLFPAPKEGSKTLALVDVDVLTMTEPPLLRDAAVVVQDDRIVAVGPRDEIEIPGDAVVVQGHGGTLLPGLIDAHVHLRDATSMRFYLAHGFTTVRDMNGALSKTRAVRDLIASGEMLGPRVLAAGPIVLGTPFRAYPAPRDADGGRQVVEQVRDEGFDLVKVFRVHKEAFLGLMAAARAEGIPVSGHVPDLGLDEPGHVDGVAFDGLAFETVLDSGMLSLEHILEVAEAGLGLRAHAGFGDDDLERLPEVASRIAASNVAVTTLAASALTNNRIAKDRARFLREESATIEAMVGPSGVAAIEAVDTSPWTIVPEQVVHEIIRTFHEAGVRLVVGTDSHHPVILAGSSGLDEIELLVASGLTPQEALRAATVDAAEMLGLADVGTIEVGRRADLLLVRSDPLADIRALRSPVGVVRDGTWLDREALDALRRAAVVDGAW